MNEKVNNLSILKERRKQLRNDCTPAESTLWQMLKGRQVGGYKFRRQHSVGYYILDFYCPAARLAVELDGSVHDSIEAQAYDENRTRYLEDVEHIRVLRFENRDVFDNPQGVIRRIEEALPPSLLPPLLIEEGSGVVKGQGMVTTGH